MIPRQRARDGGAIGRILAREHAELASIGEGLTDGEVRTCLAVLERLVAGLSH